MYDLNDAISKVIEYRFKDSSILEEALTHPSVNKRNSQNQIISYERLEFLGDSILNMVISSMLFKLFPHEREGALAKRKTVLICGNTIANVAKEIKLDNFIIMHYSERHNGGISNEKNLENTLEALIGAIYIDSDFYNAERFIIYHWEKIAKNILIPPQDPKTALQEWTQKHKLSLPRYELMERIGPAHKPQFTVSVYVQNYDKTTTHAHSKKEAERKAAILMLEKIGCC